VTGVSDKSVVAVARKGKSQQVCSLKYDGKLGVLFLYPA
jgi:hypothetical protein